MEMLDGIQFYLPLLTDSESARVVLVLVSLVVAVYGAYFHRGVVALLLTLSPLGMAAWFMSQPVGAQALAEPEILGLTVTNDIENGMTKYRLFARIAAEMDVLDGYRLEACYRLKTATVDKCKMLGATPVKGENAIPLYSDQVREAAVIRLHLKREEENRLVSSAVLEKY